MKEFWNMMQMAFTAIGGWLGYFLGGCDGLLIALVVFAVVDYITGVMGAVNNQKLSSEVGFRGICRKVLIFILVGIANILVQQCINNQAIILLANDHDLWQNGKKKQGETSHAICSGQRKYTR